MSATLSSYLKMLSQISASAAALPDLEERFQFVVSEQVLELPKSTYETVQDAIFRIYKYSQSKEYWGFLKQTVHTNSPITDHTPNNSSVLMAYDFHVGTDGSDPKLIEINTNASGYLLSSLLCESKKPEFEIVRQKLFESFACELALHRSMPLPKNFDGAKAILSGAKIAITDDQIQTQKMYVEFLVYKDLLNQIGSQCDLVEITKLLPNQYDLIYNRSTDFYFTTPASATLKDCYLANQTCITPNPRQYYLLADKHRLSHFSEKNLSPCLLKTTPLKELPKEEAWLQRKKLFFKPANMYGGRGAYRGSSLSQKVFERIYSEDYLAQEYSAPGILGDRKFDLRFYVYQDQIQHVTARLYAGQVTGFQAPGDGFAPVFFK